MSTTILFLVESAFKELGFGTDQVLPPNDAQWGLDKLNRMLDGWHTERLMVPFMDKLTFPFGASQQSYTIGRDSADFDADRPVKIEMANLVLTNNSPYTHVPLDLIDVYTYSTLGVPTLHTQIPTKLYYDATVPNGTLYPWPYPTNVTYQLELFVWSQLGSDNEFGDTVDLAPGYQDAIIYNLAKSLLATYPSTAAAAWISEYAKVALAKVKALNSALPPLITSDYGSGGGSGAMFDYLTGGWVRRG